ncbi:hypothetical protein PGT21_032455 [Puccinia graminis f. sp. tritici]|uniref:Uncharacterized protein n=1 Tax=Puccinia graminis f. sp. tritici TaxID=56615 RepID=A0A5B0R2J3_PUCGR|nr:hypothetical protein PGT21_032455 [Puccinia graminis f. sp. tritici]
MKASRQIPLTFLAHISFLPMKCFSLVDGLGKLEQAGSQKELGENSLQLTLSLPMAENLDQTPKCPLHVPKARLENQLGLGLQSTGRPIFGHSPNSASSLRREVKEFDFMGQTSHSIHNHWAHDNSFQSQDHLQQYETEFNHDSNSPLSLELSLSNSKDILKQQRFSSLKEGSISGGLGIVTACRQQQDINTDRIFNALKYSSVPASSSEIIHHSRVYHHMAPRFGESSKYSKSGIAQRYPTEPNVSISSPIIRDFPNLVPHNVLIPKSKKKATSVCKRKFKEIEAMDQEEEMKKDYKFDYEMRDLMLIYGVSLHLAAIEHQKLKLYHDKEISAFITQLNFKMNQFIMIRGQSSTYQRIGKKRMSLNLIEFSQTLWFVNLRFLQSIGKMNLEGYAQETLLLLEWIISLFQRIENNRSDSESDAAIRETGRLMKLETRILFNSLERTLIPDNQYEPLVFLTNGRNYRGCTISGAISKRQGMITSVVIDFLACYYKENNPKKWKKMFLRKKYFFSHIKRIQIDHLRSNQAGFRLWRKQILSMEALPWKQDITNGQESGRSSFQKYRIPKASNLKVESFVKDIRWEFEKEIHQAINEISDKEIQKIWSILLSQRYREKTWISEQERAYSDSFISQLKESKNNKNSEQVGFSSSNGELVEGIPINQIQCFHKLIWFLNHVIIESFGHIPKAEDHIYLEEQLEMQHELFHIINLSEDHEGFQRNKIYSGNDNKDRKFENTIRQSIFNFLNGGPLNENDELDLNFPQSLSHRELNILKAALLFLSHHYKKMNMSKWLTVFHNEKSFLDSFGRIEKRLNKVANFKWFMHKSLPKLKDIGLIPWNRPFHLNWEQGKQISLLFRKVI